QLDLGLARRELHRAAGLARVDAAGEPGEAGNLLPRLERELLEAALAADLRRVAEGAAPRQARVDEAALRRELGEELAHVGGNRQRLGEAGERLELHLLGAERALLGLAAGGG